MQIETTQWVLVYLGFSKPAIVGRTFWERNDLTKHYGPPQRWRRMYKHGYRAVKCLVTVDLPELEEHHA